MSVLQYVIVKIMRTDGSSFQIQLAASSLYEAAEPRMIWKHLFSAVQDELCGNKNKSVQQDVCVYARSQDAS